MPFRRKPCPFTEYQNFGLGDTLSVCNCGSRSFSGRSGRRCGDVVGHDLRLVVRRVGFHATARGLLGLVPHQGSVLLGDDLPVNDVFYPGHVVEAHLRAQWTEMHDGEPC